MLLGNILHEESIKVNLEAEHPAEAIRELVDVLVSAHDLPMSLRAPVIEAILAQEKLYPFGLENGIATPHAVIDRIDDVVGALGVSWRGIPFHSPDGLDVRLVILLVMPKKNGPENVRVLASVGHLLENAAFRHELSMACDPSYALQLIRDAESAGLHLQPI